MSICGYMDAHYDDYYTRQTATTTIIITTSLCSDSGDTVVMRKQAYALHIVLTLDSCMYRSSVCDQKT